MWQDSCPPVQGSLPRVCRDQAPCTSCVSKESWAIAAPCLYNCRALLNGAAEQPPAMTTDIWQVPHPCPGVRIRLSWRHILHRPRPVVEPGGRAGLKFGHHQRQWLPFFLLWGLQHINARLRIVCSTNEAREAHGSSYAATDQLPLASWPGRLVNISVAFLAMLLVL